MADRRQKKPETLRRTLSAISQFTLAPQTLARRLWGLTRRGADQLVAEYEARFGQEIEDIQSQLRHERSVREQLLRELDLKRKQLKAVRGIVLVMREKLAKERAAKAVLAARLMDQQAEELKLQQAAALAESRIETARTQADIEREMEAIRQLVNALYRAVAGKAGIPEGLDVVTAEFGIGEAEPDTWHGLLTDKRVGRTLQTTKGILLANEGDPITPELLTTAAEHGLLFDLVLAMKLPLTNCDL